MERNEVTVWRKASRSGAEQQCVEVAGHLGAMRDSKKPDGAVLSAPVRGFVSAIKAGRLG